MMSLSFFRWVCRGWLIVLMGAIPLAAQTVYRIWEPPYRQGIAAVVEDRIITFEEMRREMQPLIPGIQQEARSQAEFNQKMAELYQEVLQNLVDRVLIVREFARKEFRIPATYIENELDRVLIEDFGNDRQKFLAHLQQNGLTMREYRRDLEERIIVSAMRGQRRRSQAQVSPERIRKFYEDNKIHFYREEAVQLRLIMLRPIANESPDLLRQNAQRILTELDRGTPFADLAKQYSQDNRANRGGDWGWIARTDLREELSSAAFALKPGEHSQPIPLGDQLFILYAENYRPEGIQPIDEVRERIENILLNQTARQDQKAWLERLRRTAYVRYY